MVNLVRRLFTSGVLAFSTAKIEPITIPESLLSLREDEDLSEATLAALTCAAGLSDYYESVQMYDTTPFTPFRGETKQFLHVEIDNKTLESLFDLHPSLENSFDLTEFVSSASAIGIGSNGEQIVATSPTEVPDSAMVNAPVTSSADFVTLSSAATSQHLAEIERHSGPGHSRSDGVRFVPQQHSPVSVVPTTPSPMSQLHHNHHQQQQLHQQQHQQQQQQHLQGYQQALSPSLTVDEVSQAFSDDSCVFLPEYDLSISANDSAPSAVSGGWGAVHEPFYTTVKREDLGLASMTACSLEANLPGFVAATASSSSSTSAATTSNTPLSIDTKMEVDARDGLGVGGHYSGSVTATLLSPTRSSRTLSESSNTTTSTMPDSPGRSSKGSSRRRQVPKGSEEYKEKRARNNVAVRKSRAKAKDKQRQTEHRVKDLLDANETLTKKVEMLTKELTVLRGLFVNVGAQLPDDFSKLLEQS